MNRFDLTDETRELLNTIVRLDVIDACGAMELGAECSTPEVLLESISTIVYASYRSGLVNDTAHRAIVSLSDVACGAERKARGFDSARAESLARGY